MKFRSKMALKEPDREIWMQKVEVVKEKNIYIRLLNMQKISDLAWFVILQLDKIMDINLCTMSVQRKF